jgi:hypothetical protein
MKRIGYFNYTKQKQFILRNSSTLTRTRTRSGLSSNGFIENHLKTVRIGWEWSGGSTCNAANYYEDKSTNCLSLVNDLEWIVSSNEPEKQT